MDAANYESVHFTFSVKLVLLVQVQQAVPYFIAKRIEQVPAFVVSLVEKVTTHVLEDIDNPKAVIVDELRVLLK